MVTHHHAKGRALRAAHGTPRWAFGASALAVALALGAGCPPSDDTDDTVDDTDSGDTAEESLTPVVNVSASKVFLLVGETSTLTATTANATDAGYTWASSDDLVATVDATGVVTGRSHGGVTITATGSTSLTAGYVDLTVSTEIPYLDEWAGSGHADYDAEPFTHWDEDGEVSATCARCHTTTGYRDYVGDDGTPADSTEGPHPIGQVIECEACHNGATDALTHVVFPSGVRVDGLGPEAICMTCHQGRAHKGKVDDEIEDAQATGTEPAGEDLVDPDIGFVDIHYYAAGATLFGGVVHGGYEYDGQYYDQRFRHVSPRDTCIECHDQHTLALRLDDCAGCHVGVETVEDLRDIRMIASSTRDYDGDGDVAEGLSHEVAGLQAKLYQAIRNGAAQFSEDVCYNGAARPYWYVDVDGDGVCDPEDTTGYAAFTPRLAKAAYQYQLTQRDPGSYAHNGKYVIELLYDAITDLNGATTTDVDMTLAVRTDPGHFDATGEPFRHWDEDEEVDASCSKCHGGADGFAFFVQYFVSIDVLETPNGLQCETCHADWNYQGAPAFRPTTKVVFPAGNSLDAAAWGNANDMLCATCHSGRESKGTIDSYLLANDGSTGSNYPTFRNVHYLPGAATLQGSAAHGGYEYTGKTYAGKWTHNGSGSSTSCFFCHDGGLTGHTFDVREAFQANPGCGCHGGVFPDVDFGGVNYDGNVATTTLAADLASYQTALVAALNTYAAGLTPVRPPICVKDKRWYVDVAPLGTCGAEDVTSYPKGAAGWDAEMVKATHNYALSANDPGAWAHNMDYVTQLLYDSIERLDPAQLGTLTRGGP